MAAAVASIAITFFFFSSRRRHTRCSRDWSSDVCSSDLPTTSFRFPSMRLNSPQGLELSSGNVDPKRSEEHTSELQSRLHLVCRLLLEKKKNNNHTTPRVHNIYTTPLLLPHCSHTC